MRKIHLVFYVLLCFLLLCSCSATATTSNNIGQNDNKRITELEQQLADSQTQIVQLKTDVTTQTKKLTEYTNQLSDSQSKLVSCQNEAVDLKSRLDSLNAVSVTYVSYDKKYRFVGKSAEVLWLPCAGSPKVAATILPNSVVEVLFACTPETGTAQETWLYVLFPIYDSPMDNRGWIREADTQPYTAETQKLVQGDVFVKKGAEIIEGDSANLTDQKSKLDMDVRGRIEGREQDLVRVAAAGGMSFWVNIKYVAYPKIE